MVPPTWEASQGPSSLRLGHTSASLGRGPWSLPLVLELVDNGAMFEEVARLEDLADLSGASVLVRADLNVPLHRSLAGPMVVADEFRLRAALPTLEWLEAHGARVTVASHLGRPGGHPQPDLRMEPVRVRLEELVPGVEVLENLRFHPGEEANDPNFGAELVRGHDFYVNDAFGVCHRRHASVMFPPTLLPSAAGRLLHHELQALDQVAGHPDRPFTLVVGGAKVSDKIGTLRALAARADRIVVGGAMAFTFLVAQGHSVGESPVERAEVDQCRELLESGSQLDLPSDLIAVPVADPFGRHPPAGGDVQRFADDVPAGWRAFDIGPETRARYAQRIEESATVLWNGPMGVFEDPRFALGTQAVARAVGACPGFSVAGGGDTVAAIRSLGLEGQIDHLSSGGGAMLRLLEHGDLPALQALRHGRRIRAAAATSLAGRGDRR